MTKVSRDSTGSAAGSRLLIRHKFPPQWQNCFRKTPQGPGMPLSSDPIETTFAAAEGATRPPFACVMGSGALNRDRAASGAERRGQAIDAKRVFRCRRRAEPCRLARRKTGGSLRLLSTVVASPRGDWRAKVIPGSLRAIPRACVLKCASLIPRIAASGPCGLCHWLCHSFRVIRGHGALKRFQSKCKAR